VFLLFHIHSCFRRIRKVAEISCFDVAVRPSAWNSSAPNLWIFVKFYKYAGRLSTSAGKGQISVKSDKLSGTLPEYLSTFMIIPCRILPVKEKQLRQ
jgi:hypothetical protein